MLLRSLNRSVVEGFLSASVVFNVVLGLSLGIAVWGLRSHLTAEQAAHNATKLKLEVSNKSVAKLEAELVEQNRAIQQIEEDTRRRQKESEAAISKAEARAAALTSLAEQLRAYQASSVAVCADQPTPVTPEVWRQL